MYGKLEPMVSRVSQPIIILYDAVVPSRPIEPVTHGRSSGSTSLPSSALAAPAPSRSATWLISSTQPRAPWPTSSATLLPPLRISAACRSASGAGVAVGSVRPRLDGTCLKACCGGVYSRSKTSDGKIRQVGARSVSAIRMARSIRLGNCSGTVHICTYSLQTSLNRLSRSTSCW